MDIRCLSGPGVEQFVPILLATYGLDFNGRGIRRQLADQPLSVNGNLIARPSASRKRAYSTGVVVPALTFSCPRAFCMEFLEMEGELSVEIDIVISLVPLSYGCQSWSWNGCNRAEEQPVESNEKSPNKEHRSQV